MQQIYAPHQQYRRQKEEEIRTASRVQLVIMLLEGAVCFNKKASMAIEANNRQAALENVDRASKIIMHLYESLDFEKGGALSEKLASLYNYICDRYTKFVVKKIEGPEMIQSVNTVLQTLLDAWRKIEEGEKNA